MSALSDAVAELYSADPDEFTQRRKELAGQARAAGDRAAAKDIAALGKPTKSAWLVNRLVRANPTVAARLAELGDQLRAGEAALDGASIRRLSVARRELIDTLVRQATEAESGLSAALRDEVTDTFNAALADPEVASQVAAGTLVRSARWAGFGPGIGTAAIQPPATAGRAGGGSPATTRVPAPTRAKRAADDRADRKQAVEETAAEAALAVQAAAAAERDKQQAVKTIETQLADQRQQVAQGEQSVVAARRQLAKAEQDLANFQRRRTETEQKLAKARTDLKEVGAQARQAVAAQRKAQQALDRLPR